MEKTFHHRRGLRKAFWAGLVLFAGMAIASLFGELDAPPANRVWLLLLMESVWLSMSAFAVWALLATYRESWQRTGDRLVHQGIVRRQEILFSQVTALRWRQWPAGGSVVVKSDAARIAFDVQNFEAEERIALIQSLRAAVPEEKQAGWPLFCQRWAVPLLDGLEGDENRPLQENELRITRARYDRALMISLPLAVSIAIPAAILLKQFALFAFPVFLIGLWLFLRLNVPKAGMIAKRPSAEPGFNRFATSLFLCGSLTIAGVFWVESQPQLFPNPIFAQSILCVFGMSGIVIVAYALERRKRDHDESAAPDAMQRWEAAQFRGP